MDTVTNIAHEATDTTTEGGGTAHWLMTGPVVSEP
jgi:hypothetical protein